VKVLVDNCLPVSWVEFLTQHGHEASHWRNVGRSNAPDAEIMRWARDKGAVVLTHDLDFTKLLFQTGAVTPSVIQLRVDDARPAAIGETMVRVLAERTADLERGALISVESQKARCRLLPLGD
jgi:predicted nuclease of predicted toxin-antitoxin system